MKKKELTQTFTMISNWKKTFDLYGLYKNISALWGLLQVEGGGPRVVVSTAAFHARVRGSVPGLGSLKETKMFLPHPRVKFSIVGSLRDREVACSASDRQGSNFESCVWRTVSFQSSHHPQEVLLAQFSLYVHKSGLKPDSFHFISLQVGAQAYNALSIGTVPTLSMALSHLVRRTDRWTLPGNATEDPQDRIRKKNENRT